MSKVKVSWREKDVRVVKAVYIALGQIRAKLSTKARLHMHKHASVVYSEDGLSCEVKLPGIKATVKLTSTSAIFYNVESVEDIRYDTGFMSEEWIEHPEPVVFYMEETEKDRALYIDSELSHILQHRNFFVYRALVQAVGADTADSLLYQLPEYPVLERFAGLLVLTYHMQDYDYCMGFKKIVVSYHRTYGYISCRIETEVEGVYLLGLDMDKPFSGNLILTRHSD